MTAKLEAREYLVKMPSQNLLITTSVAYMSGTIELVICYTHPTTGKSREVVRKPSKDLFSQKYFDRELDAYVVQETMVDLTDNKHVHDWLD